MASPCKHTPLFFTTSEVSLWNVITDRLLPLPLVQEQLLQLPGVWALHDEPPPVEKLIFSNTHQDRHPKLLVWLRICTYGPVNCVI